MILDLVMPDSTAWRCSSGWRAIRSSVPVIVQTAPGGSRQRRLGDSRRRARFPGQAGDARARQRLAAERAQDRSAGGRNPQDAAFALRHARPRRHRHALAGDGARQPACRARRALPDPGSDRGRARRRQGAPCARHPRVERAQEPSLRGGTLRRRRRGRDRLRRFSAMRPRARSAAARSQEAGGGTLFLDEIGALPRGDRRQGSRDISPTRRPAAQRSSRGDIRLIAATGRRLIDLVRQNGISPGTLPPAQRLPDLAAAAPRAPRRHSRRLRAASWRGLRPRRGAPASPDFHVGNGSSGRRTTLARQHPRARTRDLPRDHALRRRRAHAARVSLNRRGRSGRACAYSGPRRGAFLPRRRFYRCCRSGTGPHRTVPSSRPSR